MQYLTEKIVVSMEIFILPRKMLNIMLKKLPNLSLYMLINVMLLKKICTSNSFVVLPRLHATTVDCARELINGEPGIKGETGKILQS